MLKVESVNRCGVRRVARHFDPSEISGRLENQFIGFLVRINFQNDIRAILVQI